MTNLMIFQKLKVALYNLTNYSPSRLLEAGKIVAKQQATNLHHQS